MTCHKCFTFVIFIHANFPDLVRIFSILHAIPDFPIGIPKNTRNPDFVKIHPDLRQWPPISDSNSKSCAGSLGLTNQKSGSQNRNYCLPVSRVGMCIHIYPSRGVRRCFDCSKLERAPFSIHKGHWCLKLKWQYRKFHVRRGFPICGMTDSDGIEV